MPVAPISKKSKGIWAHAVALHEQNLWPSWHKKVEQEIALGENNWFIDKALTAIQSRNEKMWSLGIKLRQKNMKRTEASNLEYLKMTFSISDTEAKHQS